MRSAVVVVLATALLGVWAGPASAAGAGPGYQAGTVTGLTAAVDARSPLYNVTVDFSLSNVTCPAVLDYSALNQFIGIKICDAGGTAPAVLTVQHPMFGVGITSMLPSTRYSVRAFVRDANQAFDPNYGEFDPTLNTVGSVTTPPAPIWVGVGDGYTSARNQTSTACWNPTTAASTACVDDILDRNNSDSSWIHQAVSKFNFGQNAFTLLGSTIPTPWLVQDVDIPTPQTATDAVVANDVVTAASLKPGATDPTDQLAKMSTLLANHQGSWNWVGVSAGLLDSGIQNAVWSVYGTGTPAAGGVASGIPQGTYDPWTLKVGSANACPNLGNVVSTVQAKSADIVSGLQNVMNTAQAVSPGTRVLMVEYPYLTENLGDTTVLGAANKCAQDLNANGVADNREGTKALNAVVQSAVDSFRPPVGSGLQPLVYGLDLAAAFGDRPVGTDAAGTNSYLLRTRPWGYPYPNDGGRGVMGDVAVASAKTSGDQIPAGDTKVVTSTGAIAPQYVGPNGNWYNSPGLSVEFDVSKKGTGTTWVSQICWPDDGAITAGCVYGDRSTSTSFLRAPLLEGRALPYVGTITDDAGHIVTVMQSPSYDVTKPNVTVAKPDPAAPPWYNATQKTLTVSWSVDDVTPASGVANDASGGDPTSFTYAVTPATGWTASGNQVVINASGKYTITATAKDQAGNTNTGTSTLNVDFDAPTVVTSSSASGWTNAASVTVTNQWADAGGSLLTTGGATGLDTTGKWTKTVTAEGDYTVTGPNASDNAGNKATPPPVRVQIDRTPPIVTIAGAKDGDTFDFQTGTVPTPTCGSITDPPAAGVSASSGPNLASCTVSASTSTAPDGQSVLYTFTVTARDNAGNVGTAVAHVTGTGILPISNGRMTGSAYLDKKAASATHGGTEVLFTTVSPGAGSTVAAGSKLTANYYDETKIATTGAFAPSVTLVDSNGNSVPVSLDPFTPALITPLSVTLPANLPAGAYTVTFKAWDTDQNKTGGDWDSVSWTVNVGTVSNTPEDFGSSSAQFDLRCNGSPNKFKVSWEGGSFEMNSVDRVLCWDDPRWTPMDPKAPIDSLQMSGTGTITLGDKKKSSQAGTVQFTLTDQGEPGTGRDTFSVVVTDGNGTEVYVGSGVITRGNVQAHASTGNGTNNNGCLNGPNGHRNGDCSGSSGGSSAGSNACSGKVDDRSFTVKGNDKHDHDTTRKSDSDCDNDRSSHGKS